MPIGGNTERFFVLSPSVEYDVALSCYVFLSVAQLQMIKVCHYTDVCFLLSFTINAATG